MKKKKLLLTALALSGVLTACGGGSDKPANATTATTEAVTTIAETTEPETTEPETEAPAVSVSMGEEATLGHWKFTVNEMQILDVIPNGSLQFEPGAGNKFLLISLTASNEGEEADVFLPSFGLSSDVFAQLLFGDGEELSQTNLLGYQKGLLGTSIEPLSTEEGEIAFEVPESVYDSTDPLILEFSAGNEKIDISLR